MPRGRQAGALPMNRRTGFTPVPICQSLAPNHICIITERPGLCGAVAGWMPGLPDSTHQPHRLIGKQG